jgi:hypothetical protein
LAWERGAKELEHESIRALEQHGIAIAEKSILRRNGMRVQTHHMFVACKSTDQHHQGAFGQMKIGDEAIDPLKLKAGRDENLGITLSLT